MFWVVVVLGGFGRQPFTRLRLGLWFASQALFAAALRLLLSRLRGVEVATDLRCCGASTGQAAAEHRACAVPRELNRRYVWVNAWG